VNTLVDRGAQQNSAPPALSTSVAAHLVRVSKVTQREELGEQSVPTSKHRSLAKGMNAGPGGRSWGRGRGVIRLGDAVGAEVKSERSLFQVAGLMSEGLSVGSG